jgi:serine protease inhibitor
LITFLFQKIVQGETGNVIISPISIQTALTLTMFGATGITNEEMVKGLKYPKNYTDSSIENSFQAFTESVRRKNGLSIGKLNVDL